MSAIGIQSVHAPNTKTISSCWPLPYSSPCKGFNNTTLLKECTPITRAGICAKKSYKSQDEVTQQLTDRLIDTLANSYCN